MPRTRRKERVIHLERNTRSHSDKETTLLEFKQPSRKHQPVEIIPRNLSQETYLELLKNPKKYIVFAVGPAGTGKTMLAVQMAIKQLREGVINKIVITRPAVSVDEDHGFLPGTLTEKMEPWVMPILDVFKEYYHPREVAALIDDGILEIAPLAYIRGRTFKNSFIIADECQNCTPNQQKSLLTRLGQGSRMVVTGDLNQADRPHNNGLLDFMNKYKEAGPNRMIGLVEFSAEDIERHPVIKEILAIYKED